MKRLSNILAEHKVNVPDANDKVICNWNLEEVEDETGILPEDEKYARYDTAFNPKALSSRKDDDESYEGEEPGMSFDIAADADSVITNTWINPLEFIDEDEEFVNDKWEVIKFDKELWTKVRLLHEQATNFKQTPKVTQAELDKRDEVESEKKENPHYCLMEVKHKRDTDGWEMENKRKFYRNWTEWYETTEFNMDCPWYAEETWEDDWKNQEKNEHKRKQKAAVQLLYKKLGESRKGMKRAYNNKKYTLAQEFRKEYEYCSKWLDKLKECDEKIKQAKIKRRKNKLFDNYITLCNLGCPMTVEQLKKIINEKSLWYAEKVVASKISEWKLKDC